MSKLENENLNINTYIKQHNISKEELEAIDSLRNDPSIIIKEADKGSCVVVWDREDYLREDYLREAGGQLCDKNEYEALGKDAVNPLIKKLLNLVFSRLNNEGTFQRKQ